ncbi:MAG: hypothetical protein P4L84_01910 [Isosphaeraceae bacterium]|nr:hypothetical protein [Isosphaeraceae bacterium]
MCRFRYHPVLALAVACAVVPVVTCAAEPTPEFQAGLKRTLELRRQRRRAAAAEVPPVGAIVPYPFPPALIIRHRPEVHDDIGAFLDMLRRSSG